MKKPIKRTGSQIGSPLCSTKSTSTMSRFNPRQLVALYFMFLYVAIGIPVWYKLTNVERTKLPVKYIEALNSEKFKDVHMVIPVYIKSDVYRFPDIHEAVQTQANYLLDSQVQAINWSLQVLPFSSLPEDVQDKENIPYHVVQLVLDQEVGFLISYDSKETVVFFDDSTVISNDLPFFVAQTIVEHTFQLEWTQLSNMEKFLHNQDNVAVAYKPNMHLSFSLVVADDSPTSWEIEPVLKKYFTPFRQLLSSYVNFTIDTNIIYNNDLGLGAVTNLTDVSHNIDLSEISSMNDYTGMTTINLAIVFPYSSSREDTESTYFSHWQNYIIPQWGALIVNKNPIVPNSVLTEEYLTEIIYTFTRDLLRLLGLTDSLQEMEQPYVTLDSFKRLTALRNLNSSVESLWAMVKLTESFKQMAIPKKILDEVIEALNLRFDAIDLLNNPEKGDDSIWNTVLNISNKVVEISESIFFDGEMVQQNYFPQEHMLAVYLPLLGPLTVIIFIGGIKLLKNSMRENKKASTDEKMVEKEHT